jgi:nicotinamide-nucleotide amidase
MTIAILTIGDEICLGQIVNTNAAWMADVCAREGWRVVAHSVVGDEQAQMITEFDRLLGIADVVLVTGGLGPTHDDRTKAALVEYLSDSLVLHEPTLEHLTSMFRKRGRTMTERNAAQAHLPAKCNVLQNDNGTAAGMWFRLTSADLAGKHTGKILISMPGVPQEMKHIIEDRVIPRLREQSVNDAVMCYTTLLTTGIAESMLADMIGDMNEFLEGHELAFLPSSGGVRLRITATAANRIEADAALARIEAVIRSRAGKYIYGKDNDGYNEIVGKMLIAQGLTVAVAESCTGGMLGAALTAMRGSSAYFLGGVQCYSNEAKVQFVGVREETIVTHGAVSAETARELARGIRTRFGADIGIAITGVAGPDGGTVEKPVGTVWIGIAIAIADGMQPATGITATGITATGITATGITATGITATGITATGITTDDAHRYSFGNDRTANRERAVSTALQLIYSVIHSLEHSSERSP